MFSNMKKTEKASKKEVIIENRVQTTTYSNTTKITAKDLQYVDRQLSSTSNFHGTPPTSSLVSRQRPPISTFVDTPTHKVTSKSISNMPSSTLIDRQFPFRSSLRGTSSTSSFVDGQFPPRSSFIGTPSTSSSVDRQFPTRSSFLGTPTSSSGFSFVKHDACPKPKTVPIANYFPQNKPNTENVSLSHQDLLKINVEKSKKFYDNDASSIPTYKTSSDKRGKVLLINNVFEGEKSYRAGAEVDEKNITELFRQMGFRIEKYRNKTKKQMECIVENFRNNKSLKEYDINIVVIMSHGNGTYDNGNTNIMTKDNQTISTTWIVNQFDATKCKGLIGKPKIFIFQCCRGDQKDIEVDTVPFIPPRSQADILVAHSTIPGFVSHRNPKTGTWYIQAICEVFMKHAHDTDVENLLKIVDAKLEKRIQTSRQTSSYENRGFKRCFLHPR